MRLNGKKGRWLKAFISSMLILVMMSGMIVSPIFTARANASPVDDILNEVLDKVGLREAAEDLSGFMGGDMEALQKAFQSVTGGPAGDTSVSESAEGTVEDISKILEILQDLAAKGNIGVTLLRAVPFNFGVETDLPAITVDGVRLEARAWADKRDNGTVSAAIRIDGSDGGQALLGIGNDSPLGRGNAEHFSNESNTAYAFLDLTRNGKSYVHLRIPLVFGTASFSAMDYLSVPGLDNKYVQVKIGAMDESTVELEFEFSLKGTIDAGITGDVETTATLSFEVSQPAADKLLRNMTSQIAKSTIAITSKYTDSNGNFIKTPTSAEAVDDAASIIKSTMEWLYGYSQREQEALGEISLGVGLNGSVGLGAADTVWPGVSASAGMSVSFPSGGLISVSDSMVKSFIEFGPYMSQDLQNVLSRMMYGTALNVSDFSALNTMWEATGQPFMSSIITAVGAEDVSMDLNASLNLAGNGGKDESVELMSVGANIPGGAVIQSNFIGQTFQAVGVIIGGMLKGSSMSYLIPKTVNPIIAEDGIADSVLEGTTISLCTSVVPTVQLTAEFPAKPFVRALVDSGDLINAKLNEAAFRTSLKPIEEMMNGLEAQLGVAFEGLRNSTFGLNLGGGTSADLGAEAVVSLSAGINVSAWTNTEMLLFMTGFDDLGTSGAAGMKATVSAGVGGGLSLGEGVEVGATGTMTVNQDLLGFEFNEVDGPIEPLYWKYDSSNTYLMGIKALPVSMGAPFEMTPGLQTSVTDYNLWVPYSRGGQSFYLNFTQAHPGQYIEVQEDNNTKQDYDPNKVYNISGTGVTKKFKVFVTSGNKRANRQYNLFVRMEHSDKLERLQVMEDKGAGGKADIMSSSFDPYVTAYSLNVGEHTQYVEINMLKEDVNGAKIMVNGSEWDQQKPYRFPLKHGDNSVNITLTAEDVREPKAAMEKTYRVAVYRALSSNANLNYFTLSKGGGEDKKTPIDLDFNNFDSYFEVDGSARTVEFRFSTVEKNAKVWINDELCVPDSEDGHYSKVVSLRVNRTDLPENLYPGNSFYVYIQAPDGFSRKFFWVNVERPLPEWGDNPGLISLAADGQYTLSSPAEGVYRLNLDPASPSVHITVETERVASFNVLGSSSFHVNSRDETNTLWDITSIFGNGIEHTLPIEVTTNSGKKARYLLLVNGKDDWIVKPHLTVTDDEGKLLKLTPKDKRVQSYIFDFDQSLTEYELTVPANTQELTVNAWSEGDKAWVTVNGQLSKIPVIGENIITPVKVPLDQGLNRIEMTLGAPSGRTKTYTVMVKREYQPERNPEVQSIALSAPGTFDSKSLNIAEPSHNIDVTSSTGEITITVTPEAQATAVLNYNKGGSGAQAINGYTGTFPLQIGENVIGVETTSADGLLKQVYTITVNRPLSSDAFLDYVKLDGQTLRNLAWSSGGSVSFPYTTASIMLEAAPKVMPGDGPGASLTVNGTPYEIGTQMEIPLEEKFNYIKILVTAEDSRTTWTYSIGATRDDPPDVTPPNLALQDITVEASSPQGAHVTYWPMAMDERDGWTSVISTPGSGFLFGLGETTVTAWSEDHSGNRATGTFKVTVQDTTPPVITVPVDIIVPVDETGKSGTAYFDEISALDAVDGPVEVITTFRSGAKFPLGSTNVTSIAEDSRGNIAMKTFTVLVTNDLGVASASPAKNRQDVSPGSVISLTFNKNAQLMPAALDISVREDSSVLASTFSLSQDGRTLTIVPSGGLNYGRVYTVTLPAGVAVDAGDAAKLSLPYTLSFRTAEAPPTAAETDAAGRTVTLTFSKAMADSAGKQAQFKAYVNGAERGFSAAARGENKKQILLTLAGPALADSDNVTISYGPGDVTSADGGILGAFSWTPVVNRTTFAGGSGTAADPYLIRNSGQLNMMRNNLSAHYKLTAKINLSNYTNWTPIGDSAAPFTGSFEGGGYTIDGLSISRPGDDYVGLFGYISGGAVNNLKLTNVNVWGRNNVGALAGFISGTGTITNIHAEGQISAGNSTGENVGGLFGVSYTGISGASFKGRVLGKQNVGGIAGVLANSGISGSYARAEVQAVGSAGGLIGLLYGTEQRAEVADSYALGQIVSRNGETVSTAGFGGLVGRIAGDFKGGIVNSYTIGTLSVQSLPEPLMAGVVGNGEEAGISVESSFYSNDAQGLSGNLHYGTPMAGPLFKAADSFSGAGWDFIDVWAIGDGTYPYLKQQGYSDFAPPAVTAFNPADGAEDVPVNSTLTIAFDEPVQDSGDITLTIGGQNVPFTAVLSGDSKTISVTPTGNLRGFGRYTLKVAGVADAYYNEMTAAEITFQTGKPPVESILVKSSTDTLQVNSVMLMWAEVVPGTAGMNLTWSVEPGTGTATIDQGGWLTCTGVGTVTVRATANDGTGVSGSKVITIKGKPVLQSVTLNLSEIPEGTAADITVTVLTEHVADGTVVTAQLLNNYGQLVPGVEASGTITDNHAELVLSVSNAVFGNYRIYTTLEDVRLFDSKNISILKVWPLNAPIFTGSSSGANLSWFAVPEAGSYEVNITSVSPTEGLIKTVTVEAVPGQNEFSLDLSDPELGLSVIDSVYNPIFSVTITAKPAPDDILHTVSAPSVPFKYSTGLESISLVEIPDHYTEYTYFTGDSFRPTGLVVRANFGDGSSKVLNDITEDNIVGFDSSQPGWQTLTVTYGGKTALGSFDVLFKEPNLVGLNIITPPSKTLYYLGESLDLTGLVVKAVYENGAEKEIPVEELTIVGFDNSNVTQGKSIRVDYGGLFDYFDIAVHFYTSASLSPSDINFDMNAPADLEVAITWNHAAKITEVTFFRDGFNNGSGGMELRLQEGRDYTVSSKDGQDILTINKALFNGAEVEEYYDFTLDFDKGMFQNISGFVVDSSNILYDASLSGLKVGNALVPGFDPGRYNYVVVLPKGTAPDDDLTWVDAETSDGLAAIDITQTMDLPDIATVKVTSRYGTVQVYTVRLVLEGTVISNDATLSQLKVGDASIEGFDSGSYNYVVQLTADTKPGDAATLVTAEATHTEAFVKITQAEAIPGTATVEVTAEDGMAKQTYNINFELPGPILSGETSLDQLTVGGVAVAGFDPGVYSYDVQLPTGTKVGSAAALVTATANHPKAVVTVTQAGIVPGSATVEITAEDGIAKQIYTVNLVTPAVHSVVVSANPSANGVVVGGSAYSEGAAVTVTAIAQKGYKFINWTEIGVEISKSASYTFTMGTADRSLTANFGALPTYTVTFDAQGGSPVDSISGVVSGAKISAPAAPTLSGNTFGGWYKEAAFTNAWDFGRDTVTGNITLYAKWIANPQATYTVSVSANPSAGGSVTGGGIHSEGASVTVTASVYSGYSFVNWTEDGAQVSTNATYTFTLGTEGRSLTANFEPIPTYSVTFDTQGGSVVADINNVVLGTKISAPAVPTRSGHIFGGWYKEAAFTTAWDFGTDTVTGNVTLYAKWTANPSVTYTVSVSAGPSAGGSVTGGGIYSEEASVTVTAAPHSGYSFVNWTEGGVEVSTNTAYTFTLGTAGRSLTANFEPIPTYSVTFDAKGGSAVAGISDVTYGSAIIEPAAPERSGYTFGGWYKEGAGANGWNFGTDTVTGDITLYAKWMANPPVTYSVGVSASSSEGGTVSGGGTFGQGAAVTVTAAATSGYRFVNWTENGGEVSTNAAYTFTLDAGDRNLTANFELLSTYNVIFDSQGGSVVDGVYGVISGDKISVPAAPTWTGYTFDGWYKEAACTTAWDFGTDTVTGDITLYAKWTANPQATMESIAITAPATKLQYTVGESLDLSGMVVTGTYSDSTTKVETVTEANVSGFDSSAPAADQVLTVTLGGKTTTYTVTINAAPEATLESIAITTPATKLQYTVGESLDLSGMVVTGSYSDSTTKTETVSEANVSGFDSSAPAANQVLTVTVDGKTATYTVAINAASNNNDGTSSPTATPVVEDTKVEASITGKTAKVTTTTTAAVDDSGKASAEVTQTQVSDAISKAVEEAEKLNGTAAIVEIKVEAPKDTKTVETSIPIAAIKLAAEGKTKALTLSMPVAAITFDAKTLSTISGEAAEAVKISASKVETSSLSAETQQLVGDRPVFNFSVTSGDQTISKFGGNVSISVPYTPKAGEDPNAIVIYYINAEGKPEIISNCSYDPTTGTVSFKTNHFSQYAVGYNKVNFEDVVADAWYSKAVGLIAARGITTGIGNGNYGPEAKLTRGQFLVMMMRAYGIEADANPTNNFTDAGSTYYTGYLAAAKSLGLSGGVGNNMFAPDKEITRQEMFTLLYNALKIIGELPEGNLGKQLSAFNDAGQIAPWAENAMALMVKTATINGSEGKLSPTATTTRAEMAQVLYNLLSK
ncbi:MAG: InlB B-repeat-containing protein [Thermincola sp.]|jgi:uncharacterized repeat protein (TIGR02543 family)|nr:InlB B-repeat-containing protein [Thermincola sp.]MDT3701865.1 InlB B-repeat-containing protein [Thermincola sp.]